MRSRISAGLLMYRMGSNGLQVFLAHPGGPFFVRKDHGHWTIPKGEVDPGESDLLATAIREFQEEIGIAPLPNTGFLSLGSIRQTGGKVVHAWGFAGDYPENTPVRSNLFSIEWPPHSGTLQEFPEVDRAQFFDLPEAKLRVKPTQVPLLDELARQLTASRTDETHPDASRSGTASERRSSR